jgi:holo-[acyl-carrier protein] synthase
MIYGIGIDLVTINRFESWTEFPVQQLEKIFSPQELQECLDSNNQYILEKLAARFAAKEAFFKAFSATLVALKQNKLKFSLKALSPHISVVTGEWGVPMLVVDWQQAEKLGNAKLQSLQVHLSLSHEKTMAVAMVVIESVSKS